MSAPKTKPPEKKKTEPTAGGGGGGGGTPGGDGPGGGNTQGGDTSTTININININDGTPTQGSDTQQTTGGIRLGGRRPKNVDTDATEKSTTAGDQAADHPSIRQRVQNGLKKAKDFAGNRINDARKGLANLASGLGDWTMNVGQSVEGASQNAPKVGGDGKGGAGE